MCRVLNKHHAGVPAGAVYIGRGSKWGNPFRIGPDGDRAAVIAKYQRWLADQYQLLRERGAGAAHRVVARREGGGAVRARAWPGRD